MIVSEFSFKIVKHSLLSDSAIHKIIGLKKQYWNYSLKSHKNWLNENINKDEYHIWIENENGNILAYLNLVFVEIKLDMKIEEYVGIGNVCTNKRVSGEGFGLLLMHVCNFFINSQNKKAVLLCKNSLVKFYKKSGWETFSGDVILENIKFEGKVMFNKLPHASEIAINRNF